jgi:hypothetical protein
MMTRNHGDLEFECDVCGEVIQTNTGNFESAQNILHRQHWQARKHGSSWDHFCPQCK